MDKQAFPKLLRTIYDTVDALEAMFPGRHFTPDGHMVGSLGEALAAYHYGIQLSQASTECHDGICQTRQVQVKATQGDRVAITQPARTLACPQAQSRWYFRGGIQRPWGAGVEPGGTQASTEERSVPNFLIYLAQVDEGCEST